VGGVRHHHPMASDAITNDDIAAARRDWSAATDPVEAEALHRFYANLISGQALQITLEFRAASTPSPDEVADVD